MVNQKQRCRAKNPATCRTHGQPLAPIPEMYQTIEPVFNTDEEHFNELKYIQKATTYLKTLTPEQVKALQGYVIADYNDINSALYGNSKASTETKTSIKHLDAALKNAPQAPPVLWRSLSGFELPKNFNKQNYKPGDVLKFKGFTSTSETPSALMHIPNDMTWYMRETPSDEYQYDPNFKYRVMLPEKYAEERKAQNVLFMIKTRKAAPVSVLRSTTAEQEWLIPRNTEYRITEIHENRTLSGENHRTSTRATIYVLEEV